MATTVTVFETVKAEYFIRLYKQSPIHNRSQICSECKRLMMLDIWNQD